MVYPMNTIDYSRTHMLNYSPGKLRCLGCPRAFADYLGLAQHLKDSHDGLNAANGADSTPSGRAPQPNFTLGDVLASALQEKKQAAPSAHPAAHPRSATRDQHTTPATSVPQALAVRNLLEIPHLHAPRPCLFLMHFLVLRSRGTSV